MGDMLRQGNEWLQQQRAAHMASPVTYRRAGQPDKVVVATFGKTDYEVADDYGATIQTQVIDFLILASELEFPPQAGDVIVANNSNYETMSLAGQGCWRWSDSYKITYRIHTKDTGPDS